VNKSAFVRSLPDVPAAEVVAKAKVQGFELTDRYVYNIRAKAKARGGKPIGRPGRKPGRSKGSGAVRGGASAEQQFVELALQVGLDRAEALLQKVQAAIKRAVLG
jgi:hypothetical protein